MSASDSTASFGSSTVTDSVSWRSAVSDTAAAASGDDSRGRSGVWFDPRFTATHPSPSGSAPRWAASAVPVPGRVNRDSDRGTGNSTGGRGGVIGIVSAGSGPTNFFSNHGRLATRTSASAAGGIGSPAAGAAVGADGNGTGTAPSASATAGRAMTPANVVAKTNRPDHPTARRHRPVAPPVVSNTGHADRPAGGRVTAECGDERGDDLRTRRNPGTLDEGDFNHGPER